MDIENKKRKEIFDAAKKLFSHKGYVATSVQDIANECNMSKATIYKYFTSKEDILIKIIEYFQYNMKKIIYEIDLKEGLSPEETYEEKIYVLFRYFIMKKEISMMIYQNDGLLKNEEVREALINNRRIMIAELSKILVNTYGDDIKPFVLDVVMCLTGIIKEFITLFIIKEISIVNYRDISKFIVEVTNSLIDIHRNYDSFIPLNILKELKKNNEYISDKQYLNSEWKEKILEIKCKINDSKKIKNKEEILDALSLLEKEKRENKNNIIVKSLIGYIGNEEELKEDSYYLTQIWGKLKKEG